MTAPACFDPELAELASLIDTLARIRAEPAPAEPAPAPTARRLEIERLFSLMGSEALDGFAGIVDPGRPAPAAEPEPAPSRSQGHSYAGMLIDYIPRTRAESRRGGWYGHGGTR